MMTFAVPHYLLKTTRTNERNYLAGGYWPLSSRFVPGFLP